MDSPIEPKNNTRKWYSKKRYIISFGLGVVLLVAGLTSGNSSSITAPNSGQVKGITNVQAVPVQNLTPLKILKIQPQPKAASGLSNNNFYTNVDGNQVHSPAYSNSVPAGASARCGDGTYSFSQHRQGTCSHHGGVAMWY